MRILLVLSSLLLLVLFGVGCSSACADVCDKYAECGMLLGMSTDTCTDLCEEAANTPGATICENRADCVVGSTCEQIKQGSCNSTPCN